MAKSVFSTSLPKAMKEEISRVADRLKRNKADIVGASLFDFFEMDREQQEQEILNFLEGTGGMKPRPFTTRIPDKLQAEINSLSTDLKRNKTTIIRTALSLFFARDQHEQEQKILQYLSQNWA